MTRAPSVFMGERFSDRTLIESIVSSFYILDYGFIKNINPDGSIDVVHARNLTTDEGVTLPPTVTKRVELLTISGTGFSVRFDYQKGDKVLLLGLKDFVEHVENVQGSNESKNFMHYSRETLKAIPLCVFNNDARVKIKADQGNLEVTTSQQIKLNGDSKSFVTYAELNSALQELWGKIKGHTHAVSTTGTAAAQTGTASASTSLATATLDISAAETTTVKTGG